jgi:hypothetical protein
MGIETQNLTNNLALASLLGFLLLFSALSPSSSTANPGDSDEVCYTPEQLAPFTDHFSQVRYFKSNCFERGSPWTLILETLTDIKDMDANNPTDLENPSPIQDDFSAKAVSKSGWWTYFKKRALSFRLNPDRCTPGVFAYVISGQRGVIYLCPEFFKADRILRIDVLLHEVKHFEGPRHVTCTRGLDKNHRACDQSLKDKGSYAVSLQSSVTLGLKGKGFKESEKALARARALYLLHNRFNEETEVKVKESVYLENTDGEVFEWDPLGKDELRFIKQLPEPAKIRTTGMDAVIYPQDLNLDAYRVSEDFKFKSTQPGRFADLYNKKSPSDRAALKDVSYNRNGGYITDAGLYMICGRTMSALLNARLPENPISLLTLDREFGQPVDYLMGASGQLYEFSCATSAGGIKFAPKDLKISTQVKATALASRLRFALTHSGELFELKKDENQFVLGKDVKFSGVNQNWIELASRAMPYLFDGPRVIWEKTSEESF